MNVFEDNPKNIYVIKHRLGELKKHPSDTCFHYYVGDFIVKIFTHQIQEVNDAAIMAQSEDCLTKHDKVDVNLYEWQRRSKVSHETRYETMLNMDQDPRFKDYAPIKHGAQYMRPETGVGMPLLNLCELIKYLHRLSNLAVFY